MIRNANLETLDVFLTYARPERRTIEYTATLLNGSIFTQVMGTPTEFVKVNLVCGWDVVQQLINYATTKEILTINFLDFEKRGFILNSPSYDIGERNDTNPKYIVSFEMAVAE